MALIVTQANVVINSVSFGPNTVLDLADAPSNWLVTQGGKVKVITGGPFDWVDGSYPSSNLVRYLGRYWVATVDIVSGQTPGTDSAWQVVTYLPDSGTLADGDKGDITVTGNGDHMEIDPGAVTTTELGGDITPAAKEFLKKNSIGAQLTYLTIGTAGQQSSSAFEPAGAVSAHSATTNGVHGITTAAASLLDDTSLDAIINTLGQATFTGTGGIVRKNAPTFTGGITSDGLSVAAGSLSASAPVTFTQTWNNAGITFEAFKVNATNTASAAGSFVARFQVNGTDVMSIDSAGKLTTTSDIKTGSTGFFLWQSRSIINSPADGSVLFRNAAATGFTSLQLGGTTSSFAALRLRSTALEARLADDSAITTLVGAMVVNAGAITDANFTNPVSGCFGVDTTNSKFYVRVGSTWKGVTVA